MRPPLISGSEPSAEQRPIRADMRARIEQSFEGDTPIAKNCALWAHGTRGCASCMRQQHILFQFTQSGGSSCAGVQS